MRLAIEYDRDELAAFCRRHNIQKLSLFGSVLRDDFRSDSDIDVLVEFDPVHVPGYLRLYEVQQELSTIMGGRPVDLVTPNFLNARIAADVLASAEVQYAQG